MENPLPIKRIHHVEFRGGNARQAAFFHRNAFPNPETRGCLLEITPGEPAPGTSF
jgi:hypothetical protein